MCCAIVDGTLSILCSITHLQWLVKFRKKPDDEGNDDEDDDDDDIVVIFYGCL
jgi:hypothetical protein